MFLKTKIIPDYPTHVSNSLFKHHARLILKKLKIAENANLTDELIHSILLELDLYPRDFSNK